MGMLLAFDMGINQDHYRALAGKWMEDPTLPAGAGGSFQALIELKCWDPLELDLHMQYEVDKMLGRKCNISCALTRAGKQTD